MKKTITTAIALAFMFVVGCTGDFIAEFPTASDSPSDLHRYKKQAVEIVRVGLMNKNALVRTNSIEVVSSTKTIQLMPMVLKLTKSQAVPVRFAAAIAMGDVKYTAAEYTLKEMLRDKDENVRIAAAYSLTKLGVANYHDKILKALVSNDPTVQANAALLIGKLDYKPAIKALYKLIDDPKSNDMVKIQAVESIAMLGDEKIYPSLWAMLISRYADDRIMGVRAMGALGTQEAKDSIMKLLSHEDNNPDQIGKNLGDEDIWVRLCAAEQLGRFGSKAGEKDVADYFSGISHNLNRLPSSPGNQLAIMAIGRINSSNLNRYLPKLLSNPNKDLKLAAAQSLLLVVK
jgi:HEAT repeat protein